MDHPNLRNGLAESTNQGMTLDGCERFTIYQQKVRTLLEEIPKLHDALTLLHPKPIDVSINGWETMRKRYESFQRQGNQPVVVATMYGPTGAGKSTTFRLITGLDVPAGGKRPMTFASFAAVPEQLNRTEALTALFPEFELSPLESMEDLKKKNEDPKRLFFQTYPCPEDSQTFPLVLTDVPDFNSVETSNWDKAEAILQLSQVVLFVVQKDSYANNEVFRELHRCCRIASKMAYLLTRTSASEAHEIWQDVIEQKTMPGASSYDFTQQRADGRTLRQFLQSASVYYFPYTERKEDQHLGCIQPIHAETCSIQKLLSGLDREVQDLLLNSLLESTHQALPGCERTIQEAEDWKIFFAKNEPLVEKDIAESAQKIAESIGFPAGRFLQLLMEEAEKYQQNWYRTITKPIRLLGGWLNSGVKMIQSAGQELIDRIAKKPDPMQVRSREDQEREYLLQQADLLFDRWDRQYREYHDTVFLPERLIHIKDLLRQEPLPQVQTEWETFVRQEVSAWVQNNSIVVYVLPILRDCAAVGAGGLLIADLVITGGMLGTTLGAATGGGVLAGGAAWFLEQMKKWKLEAQLQAADKKWRQTRQQDFRKFLREQFTAKLLEPILRQHDALQPLDLPRLQEACRSLRSLHL